jgi:D-tyrosyl-tRNA(Tyr) deacylase
LQTRYNRPMKIVYQRVNNAQVQVDGQITGQIGLGAVVLVGFTHTDTNEVVAAMAKKIKNLRTFSDSSGKMNCDITEVRGSLLVVSQFTLYADTSGRRPGFTEASPPEMAKNLYGEFIQRLRELDLQVETGEFGEHMQVTLTNDGPVTLILEKAT